MADPFGLTVAFSTACVVEMDVAAFVATEGTDPADAVTELVDPPDVPWLVGDAGHPSARSEEYVDWAVARLLWSVVRSVWSEVSWFWSFVSCCCALSSVD